MSKLIEKTIEEKVVYKGSFLELHKDEVMLPNETLGTREYLHHPGAVAILVIDNDNNIYLEKQYRYPMKEVIYEIPAGKLEGKEDLLKAAYRELKEETGLIGEGLEKLGVLYPCVGYSDEVIHIYYLDKFSLGEQQLDKDEFLDIIKVPFKKVKEMILDGTIKDGKTIYALYLYEMKNKVIY